MGYLNIEDMSGNIEVVVFPETFQESQEMFTQETPLIISGQTDKTDKGLKIIARKIASIENSEQLEELKNFTPLDIEPELTPEHFTELITPLLLGIERKITFTTVHRRKTVLFIRWSLMSN